LSEELKRQNVSALHPSGVASYLEAFAAMHPQSLNVTRLAQHLLQQERGIDTSFELPFVGQPSACLPLGSAAALGLKPLVYAMRWWPVGALKFIGDPRIVSLAMQAISRSVHDEVGEAVLSILRGSNASLQEPRSTEEILDEFSEMFQVPSGSLPTFQGNATVEKLLASITVCVDALSAPALFDLHIRIMAAVHDFQNGTTAGIVRAIEAVSSSSAPAGASISCSGGSQGSAESAAAWSQQLDELIGEIGPSRVVLDPSGLSSLLGVLVPSRAGKDPRQASRAYAAAYESICDIRAHGVAAVAQQCNARVIPALDSVLEAYNIHDMLTGSVASIENATLPRAVHDLASTAEHAAAVIGRAVALGIVPATITNEELQAGLHDALIDGAGLRPKRSLATIHALCLLLAPHVPVVSVTGSGAFAEVRAGSLTLDGVVFVREPVVDEGVALRARYADVLTARLGLELGVNATELGNLTLALKYGLLPVFVPDETRLVQLFKTIADGDTYWLDTFVDPIGASNGVLVGGLVSMPSGHGTYVGDLNARSKTTLRGSGVFGFFAQTRGGAVTADCIMCEVVIDRSVGALNAVRGSLGWTDSDSDGEFELDMSAYTLMDPPTATIGGGFVSATGAATTLSVWKSTLSHNAAHMAMGGAIMIGESAQGRTHIHASIVHGCDAYLGGGVAGAGYGDFVATLDTASRRQTGGSTGIGKEAKLGLGYSLFTQSEFAGYESPKRTEVEYVPFQTMPFESDRTAQEAAYAHVAEQGTAGVALPPFSVSLGGNSATDGAY